jgi:hypothetical protein
MHVTLKNSGKNCSNYDWSVIINYSALTFLENGHDHRLLPQRGKVLSYLLTYSQS